MTSVVLSIGSNVGDRLGRLQSVVAQNAVDARLGGDIGNEIVKAGRADVTRHLVALVVLDLR